MVDSSPRLASADATHQRDSFVHRIARGLARKRSAAATPAAPVPEATTSPTTMSPPLSPIQQLASPSIRSPTSLPASSPPAEYERDQKDALHLRGDDDTPIPSPPASALAEPTYERPRPFRTLNWSFLPSRSARVVANRRPVIDRPLNDEEREWVEVAAKVPDDGTTRDRWDNPIGTRGDWGRTVLSEFAGVVLACTGRPRADLIPAQVRSSPRRKRRLCRFSSRKRILTRRHQPARTNISARHWSKATLLSLRATVRTPQKGRTTLRCRPEDATSFRHR